MIATVENPNHLIIRANRSSDKPEVAELTAAALQRGDRVSVFGVSASGEKTLVANMRWTGPSIAVVTFTASTRHLDIPTAITAALRPFEETLVDKSLWMPRRRDD